MIRVLVGGVALALVAFLGAHVSLVGGLVTRRPRYRAAVAFALPPLAPYWGWRAGLRRRVYVWTSALLLYAMGVFALVR
jgi:hypothetical protein